MDAPRKKFAIHEDPEFAAFLRAEIAAQVETELSKHVQALLWIIARNNVRNAAAISRPRYVFAPLFLFVGGLFGGVGFWHVASRFRSVTITDASGQEWAAISMLADPVFVALFVASGVCLCASVGAGIGLVFDNMRARRR